MEFETEWEQRNYERQKKLGMNRFTFISRQDENALRRKRKVVILAVIGALVGGLILSFAITVLVLKLAEGDQNTIGEIIKKIYEVFKEVLKQLSNPEVWQMLWKDITCGDSQLRLKLFSLIGQVILVAYIIWYGIKRTKINYDKEIVFDLNTKEIAYKDNKTTAQFNSGDIERWESFESIQAKRTGDIFVLKDLRVFYLDGFYQDDLHEFLIAHKEELKLPKQIKLSPNEMQKYL